MGSNDFAEIGFVAGDGSEIDQNVYYIGLDVPAGRRVYISGRLLKLTENTYNVDLIRPADGFTGGTLGFHHVLNEGGTDNVQTRVYGDVTPAGALTVLANEYVDSGTDPGVSRGPGFFSTRQGARSYTTPHVLRITRPDTGGPYNLDISMLAYEEAEE